MLFVIGSNTRIIFWVLKTDGFKNQAIALTAGMVGIMAASYGSGALGQMPNGIIVYMSMAYVFLMPQWEQEIHKP